MVVPCAFDRKWRCGRLVEVGHRCRYRALTPAIGGVDSSLRVGDSRPTVAVEVCMRLRLLLPILVLWSCSQVTSSPSEEPLPASFEAASSVAKPMLPAYPSLEELTSGKADQYSDYKDARPGTYGITLPPSVSVRPAAEYENASRLILTFSSSSLPTQIKSNLADVAKDAAEVTDVYVIYDSTTAKSSFDSALVSAGGSVGDIHYLNMENDSIWVRDFGPISVLDSTGKVGIVDLRYYPQRIYDDAIPTLLGDLWGLTTYRAPIDFEGGNFMSDAAGHCFASQGLLWYNSVSEADVRKYMADYLGCQELTIVTPLDGEGTTHIDMQAKIVSNSAIIVGEYTSAQDATNKAITDANADMLEAAGYTIYRMPMPDNDDGNFRTYTNSLFVNGLNFVPVYSINQDLQAQAIAVWQQAMPTWDHIPVLSDTVITWAGATHCITMTLAEGTLAPIEAAPADACSGDWACYPDASTPTSCDGLTYEGCCEGNVVYWCENNEVQNQNCGTDPQCGWDAQKQYYACGTDGSGDPSGEFPLSCSGTCTPSCAGKECGDDGCGGSCGSCAASETCQNGICGGTVDPCNGVTYEGCCDGATLVWCEDGQLGSQDCGQESSCGWNGANGYYDCGTTGLSDPSGEFPRECEAACVPTCEGRECGPDGCGGICGVCDEGSTCQMDGQCECTPVCADPQSGNLYQCGDDGCGGSCGDCAELNAVCTDHICECVSSCEGLTCGDDGCGGSCGACDAGTVCQNGSCWAESPCEGIPEIGLCEDDVLYRCVDEAIVQTDCRASSQVCEFVAAAGNNACVTVCVPTCGDRVCGDDGCGGSCGTCDKGTACDGDGQCVEDSEICIPDCAGIQCGDDGCGGSCGSCETGWNCDAGTCTESQQQCENGQEWDGTECVDIFPMDESSSGGCTTHGGRSVESLLLVLLSGLILAGWRRSRRTA